MFCHVHDFEIAHQTSQIEEKSINDPFGIWIYWTKLQSHVHWCLFSKQTIVFFFLSVSKLLQTTLTNRMCLLFKWILSFHSYYYFNLGILYMYSNVMLKNIWPVQRKNECLHFQIFKEIVNNMAFTMTNTTRLK